jgi:phospholipid-binding lipoprotein MlaA
VTPVFGPTTTRDLSGTVADILMSPLSPLGLLPPNVRFETGVGLRVLEFTDTRDRYKQTIDELLYESEDPYVSLRSVYLQRRRAQVAGEDAGAEALPNIFENQ